MEYFVQSSTKSSKGFTDTIDCEKWGIENMEIGERATVICFPFQDSQKVYVYGVFENNGAGKFATWFQVKREKIMTTKHVIKHGSGFYYKENKLAKRLVDCFSVFQYPKAATQYNSIDEAQEFIDDFLSEFTILTIEPVDENNIS